MEEEEIGNDSLLRAVLRRAASNSLNDLRSNKMYSAQQDATAVNQFAGTGTTFEDAAIAALAAPLRFVKNAATETFDSIGRVGRDLAGGAAAVVTNTPSLATRQASGADVFNTIDFFGTLGGLAGARYIIKKNAHHAAKAAKIKDLALKEKNSVLNQYLDNPEEAARRINALVDSKITREKILEMAQNVKKVPTNVGNTSTPGALGEYNLRRIDLGKTKAANPHITINPNYSLESLAGTSRHEYFHAFDNANTTLHARREFSGFDKDGREVWVTKWDKDTPSISDQIHTDNPALFPSGDDIERSLIERRFGSYEAVFNQPSSELFKVLDDAAYLSDPVEQFARIGELRHIINQPSNLYRNVSKEEVLDILNTLNKKNSSLTGYLNSITPEKIAELLNKLPAAAGATTAANAQFGNDN